MRVPLFVDGVWRVVAGQRLCVFDAWWHGVVFVCVVAVVLCCAWRCELVHIGGCAGQLFPPRVWGRRHVYAGVWRRLVVRVL